MLYDPKWEQQTKADPFTLESLITWLEKQPAKEKYDYDNCSGECLFGLYMGTLGLSWKEVGGSCVVYGKKDIHGPFRQMVYKSVAMSFPWTFGGALKRARAAVRSMPSPQGTKT